MIKKWETLNRRTVTRTPIFELSQVTRRSQTNPLEGDFFVVNLPSWVNIFALTPQGNIVAIRQYRHGTDQITLEIPGGAIDPDETPLQAAQRELQEETGYTSNHWLAAGSVDVNPAIQDNLCHFFVALDAQKTQPTHFDEHEEIEVQEIPYPEFLQNLQDGTIRHSLIIAGAFFAQPILHARISP
jgi:8-oxo-dGTP pyrophosphatase MutT (NUDIX family)